MNRHVTSMGTAVARYLRRHHLALIALFFALAGTAYATGKIGSNDIQRGAVKSRQIAKNAVRSKHIAKDQVTASDLRNVKFIRAKSVTLRDAAGGSAAGEDLFSIGKVRLTAFCNNEGGGNLQAGIEPVVHRRGAALVIQDSAVDLHPFDVQFVVIVNAAGTLLGQERSFAILDGAAKSAGGVAAVLADPAHHRCKLTADAFG